MSPVSDPGTLIMLKSPYPWRVEEPSIYESVRVHTAIQTGRTENDLVPIAPSVRDPFWLQDMFKKILYYTRSIKITTAKKNCHVKCWWENLRFWLKTCMKLLLMLHRSVLFFSPQLGTKEGYLVKQGAIVKARDRSAFILCSKQNKIVHNLSLSFPRTGNKDGSRSTDTNWNTSKTKWWV